MRAVLDPNVVVSALLSPGRAPAKLLHCWLAGSYDLVVSPLLLADLSRTFDHPTIRPRVSDVERDELLEVLGRQAQLVDDPSEPPIVRSSDPGDDYLIMLAAKSSAMLVTGDQHLLELRDRLPVLSPGEFLLDVESER